MKAKTPRDFQLGPGMWARIGYRVHDAEGEAVESDEAELGFVFGYGALLPRVESALEGLEVGKQVSVVLNPEDAYGKRDPKAVLEVDRAEFPEHVAAGDRFEAENDNGHLVVLRVLDVTPESVILDANHPLAGQKIRFDLTVLEVRPATGDELALAEAALEEPETGEVSLIQPESLLRGVTRRYENGPADGPAAASEHLPGQSKPGSDSDGE